MDRQTSVLTAPAARMLWVTKARESAGSPNQQAGGAAAMRRRIGAIGDLPIEVRRLAWRCDKAIERREGTDRVFGLIEDLALAVQAAGYPGAAVWLGKVVDCKEEDAYWKEARTRLAG